uniref:Uncharacterized protein n=1 Tax=Oryza sativa subsp. japonica TaxID=39947 RepID=Q6K7M1_ORYSJ|nr:hypothetical protein [Oryza sativa Japonica Group]BAD28981.1 hypothetical protein [Oryza sativa Japonica Group]
MADPAAGGSGRLADKEDERWRQLGDKEEEWRWHGDEEEGRLVNEDEEWCVGNFL